MKNNKVIKGDEAVLDFITDIFELYKHENRTINLIGVKLPSNQDLYFMSKKKEIFEQYQGARIFLKETQTKDWNHWFNPAGEYQKIFEISFSQHFYEAALFYYNVIVDLSWTLCYVSAEYAIYNKNRAVDIHGIMPIEEAYKKLREAENSVTGPGSEGNPFEYLKAMQPNFSNAINLIIDFWKKFKDSTIRQNYNYIKHKGKPLYEELNTLRPGKLMGLQIKDEECPTDVRDVQLKINLMASTQDLKDFDDNILFPYIKSLFELLDKAVDPSPLIF